MIQTAYWLKDNTEHNKKMSFWKEFSWRVQCHLRKSFPFWAFFFFRKFWAIVCCYHPFGVFRFFSDRFWPFHIILSILDYLERFRVTLKHLRLFRTISGNFRLCWTILDHFGTILEISDRFGSFRNICVYFGAFQNISGYFRSF
jgi:hypothetical protein